mgnify:CR=1 FL=1
MAHHSFYVRNVFLAFAPKNNKIETTLKVKIYMEIGRRK